jgi:hypothetical protein
MGLTFFRSVRFGPLRFNFSTSGIGVSAGIRGLCIGSGPRGAYINAGTHGFRYRASLNPKHVRPSAPSAPIRLPAPPIETSNDVVSTEVYATRDVMQLTDASAADLLEVLNSQARHKARWPWILVGGLACLGYGNSLLTTSPSLWTRYAMVVALLALLCAVGWVAWRDRLRKLTVLCCDLDQTTARAYESFLGVCRSLSKVQCLWAIPSRALRRQEVSRRSDNRLPNGQNGPSL